MSLPSSPSISLSLKDYGIALGVLSLKMANILYASLVGMRVFSNSPVVTLPIGGLLSVWAVGAIHIHYSLDRIGKQYIEPLSASPPQSSHTPTLPTVRRSSCLYACCIKAPSICLDVLVNVMIIGAKGGSIASFISLGLLPYWAFYPAEPANVMLYFLETPLKFYPYFSGLLWLEYRVLEALNTWSKKDVR